MLLSGDQDCVSGREHGYSCFAECHAQVVVGPGEASHEDAVGAREPCDDVGEAEMAPDYLLCLPVHVEDAAGGVHDFLELC